MNESIIDHIIAVKDTLPKKQKQLCTFISLHATEAGMMTVAELAQNAQVGTTTVMRLIQDLGYESYNTFKRDVMSASMKQGSSSYGNRLQTIFFSSRDYSENTLAHLVGDFHRTAENMLSSDNLEQFGKAVDLLLGADRINVLGLRSSRVAAIYFEDAISLFHPMVRQLSNEQEFLFDKLLTIHPGEVLLVISQWPCTKKTIEMATACHKRGVSVALLTNTRLNPIAAFASVVIDTNSVSSSSDILPILTVLEALSYEMGKRTAPQSTENLKALDEILRENNLIIWDS